MLDNSTPAAALVNAGVVHDLVAYFECHSFDETSQGLTDLLQAWISPDEDIVRSNIAIANQVFFVANLSKLIIKIDKVKDIQDLVISDFFDKFSWDYITDLLMEALQAWIYPYDYGTRSMVRVADAVSAFALIGKLVYHIEAIKMEGGLLC